MLWHAFNLFRPMCVFVLLWLVQQESLANDKVSSRQQCVYEGPLLKKSTANQRKEHV